MKTIISILLLACLAQQTTAQIEWQHCYGGTSSDACNAIRQTFDSGYILAGVATSNNDDVNGNHGGGDFWVVKITALGDTPLVLVCNASKIPILVLVCNEDVTESRLQRE
jgi:hypothetical protein